MIKVDVDKEVIRGLYLKKLDEKIKEVDAELVYWDSKELMRRTCLSWNNIQEKFFYDPRFPKHKVGQKWMFPAKQTRDFLLTWLSEQSTN